MALLAPALSSTDVAHLGWGIGVVSATIANIAFVTVVALSPALDNRTKPAAGQKRTRLLLAIQAGLPALLAVIWLVCGLFAGRILAGTYMTWVAFGAAVTSAAVILVTMLTAANQVGLQAIRR